LNLVILDILKFNQRQKSFSLTISNNTCHLSHTAMYVYLSCYWLKTKQKIKNCIEVALLIMPCVWLPCHRVPLVYKRRSKLGPDSCHDIPESFIMVNLESTWWEHTLTDCIIIQSLNTDTRARTHTHTHNLQRHFCWLILVEISMLKPGCVHYDLTACSWQS